MHSSKTFQEAEVIYDRATRFEFAAEFKSAFRLYLEATDAFLHLSRSPVASPAFQAQCKENASKAIQRAEKIKKASKVPGAQIGLIAAPIDPFAADHQAYILRKSSTVNSVRYPLWNEPIPLPWNPGTHYSDPHGQPPIPLSRATSETITWKRPPRDPFTFREESLILTAADIEQNTINDCSVCAAVAVCIQHDQRFGSRLDYIQLVFLPAMSDSDSVHVLTPQKIQKLLSSSLLPGNQPGKYDLKVYLNGDFRRVYGPLLIQLTVTHKMSQSSIKRCRSIDDLLPYDDTGCPMGISSGRLGVAWPALIEKAYMKLMGGYDFPGSNSSIDLRILTGWIPEHIDLQSTAFERERMWERIVNGFRKGYCVLTVGTDAKTMLKITGVKLLPSHNYAVVDIQERRNERWLKLIDSRVPVAGLSSHSECKSGSSMSDSRMLDMRWDDICAAFEGIYASWNPELLNNGVDFHGVWKPADADDKVQASVHSLRLLYECRNAPDGIDDSLHARNDVWVLLTRHFSQTCREAGYISLAVQPADEDDWRDLWTKTGGTETRGPYTTSPNVLVRTKVGKDHPILSNSSNPAKTSGALSVLASYDGSFDDIYFTINVLCGADVKIWWDEAAGTGNFTSPRDCEFSTNVSGTLTTKNAGGNHTHPTYMLNPQWHLCIYDDGDGKGARGAPISDGGASPLRGHLGSSRFMSGRSRVGQKPVVALSAQGPREVPLNVTAAWSSGERIVELVQKEVVTSSGAYTYGRAKAVANMAPGDYTVVLSAFEPQIHLGQFMLKVESSHRFDLKVIPPEGAGMYTRISKGEWGGHTAAGGPSHERYHSNPIYEVQLSSNAQLGARLQLTSPTPAAALNLSLFHASASISETPFLDRTIGSSGPYSDALAGAYIPPRMLSPGRYLLVPSTFAAGVHASFQLVVYSSDSRCVVSRRS